MYSQFMMHGQKNIKSVKLYVTHSTIIWQNDDLCCANDAKTSNNST